MNKFFKATVVLIIIVNTAGVPTYAKETDINNLKEAKEYIYEHLKNRDKVISFIYTGPKDNFASNITQTIKDAYMKDDYTERSWIDIQPHATLTDEGIETTVNVGYLTTKEQEEFINEELKKATDSLIYNGMSDIDKVKKISEYIESKYEYDYTLKSTSVYTALTRTVTVCQGYSMTAYKMFNYAGIDNRIVIGTNNGASHSWNIVKIDGKWYHLDITNNDSTRSNRYFLVSDSFLENNRYIWSKSNYPEALKNYN